MSNPTWGMLAKSQDDDETIEEAIERIIAEHNSDEESHLGVGESLQSHKASEIIDHLAESIVADKLQDFIITGQKLAYDRFELACVFESLDGYIEYVTGSASSSIYVGSLRISTGATINSLYSVRAEAWTEGDGIIFAGFPRFMAVLRFASLADREGFWILGTENYNGFGFKIADGKLYAVHWADEVEYTTEITASLDFSVFHAYKVFFHTGDRIDFYVDDVIVASHSTNLIDPSVADPGGLQYWRINFENLTAANIVMTVRSVYVDFVPS